MDTLQSRLDHTDDEFAEEGTHFAVAKLLDGARERLQYATQDAVALTPWKKGADWAALFQAAVDDLAAKSSSREIAGASPGASANTVDVTRQQLATWIEHYEAAVMNSPADVRRQAPHPIRGWRKVTALAQAARPLIAYALATEALAAPGGHDKFSQAGQNALNAFEPARAAHQGERAQISPAVKAMRIAAGLVAFELETLSRVAQAAVPARAALYAVSPLRFGHGAHHAAAAPTPAPAPQPAKS